MKYSPLSKEMLENPYPFYKLMRENNPVLWSEDLQAYILTKYDDCKRVLSDNDNFARDRKRISNMAMNKPISVQTEDPPYQRKQRATLVQGINRNLQSGYLQETGVEIQKVIQSLKKSDDCMQKISLPLSHRLAVNSTGIKSFTAKEYLPIFIDITRSMDLAWDATRVQPGREAGDLLRKGIEDHLKITENDKNDFVQKLYQSEAFRNKPHEYFINTIGGVYNASFSTSYAIIGDLLGDILSDESQILNQLNHEKRIGSPAKELVRYFSPAQATMRFAINDFTIRGTKIPRGSQIVTMIASANRDDEKFIDPDKILLNRNPQDHLGFAWGPHLCVGNKLAILWIDELCDYIRKHWKNNLKIDLNKSERLDTATLRCYRKLVIK